MLLELREVSRRFGGLQAVSRLTMSVAARTIHGLIGPNGAGKSTVFNLVTGVLPLSSGDIRFRDQSISGLSPSEICRRGIARTFQAATLFRESSVLDNVRVACHLGAARGPLRTFFRTTAYRTRERTIRTRAVALLDRLRLTAVAGERADGLSQRDQKALTLAMVLATGAELVILDEPLAGLTAREGAETIATLRELRAEGTTILLVEHDMRAVMGLCDLITVLDHGTRIAEGTPREIQAHPAVIEAYLGAEDTRA